jgi:acetylornithine deacetylase
VFQDDPPTPDADTLDLAMNDLVELMAADSTSGREEPGVAAAEGIAANLGLRATRLAAAPGRDNLLIAPQAVTSPRVVLCTHIDTVAPWIGPTREADAIHGRGACDAKGAAIAMIHALLMAERHLGRAPEAACLLVVGEETDHVGARAFAAAPAVSPRHLVLGEPCGVHAAQGQKGLLKLSLVARGRPAHSAYPELGRSAIHMLVAALARLEAAQMPAEPGWGDTTMNVGLIAGGVAANVLAPSCDATVLIRCAAPTADVLDTVRAALGEEVEIAILNRVEPRHFDPFPGPTGSPQAPAVPFNTDANELAGLGASLHLLGPGDMRCAHGPDERLSRADLAAGIGAYASILMTCA